MLCGSFAHDGAELLDMGRGVRAYADEGATMGIPLLYPWANRLADFGYEAAGTEVRLTPGDDRLPVDPNGLPIHGVLPGLLRWEADRPSPDTARAQFRWSAPELLEIFPFEHELEVEARLEDRRLTIATTVFASGGASLPISFGYHPYLRIPDSDRRRWRVHLPVTKHLLLDDRMIPTGEREPVSDHDAELNDRSWDDGYDSLETPARFEVDDGRLAIALEFVNGYGFAQVYAPSGKNFICFEPMTAPTNALRSGVGLRVIDPGGEYRARFMIEVAEPAA